MKQGSQSPRRIAVVVLNDFTRDNRVLKVAMTLAHRGASVEVVALPGAGLPVHEEREGGWSVRRLSYGIWRNDRIKGVRFLRLASIAMQAVRRYRSWDAWHCNDAEAFVLGLLAKLVSPKLKLVYDCHEFESERNAKSARYLRAIGWIERTYIRYAESVITVSPSIQLAYEERYAAHGIPEVHLVRNVPHAIGALKVPELGFRERFSIPDDGFIALYQGSFTYNRGLELTIEVAAKLEGMGVHFIFMGYGPLVELVEQAANSHANIHLHPAVPYEQVLAHSSMADVGLVSVKPTCLSYLYCLPNKLFEYIQAGLPVITNNLPDCAALVREFEIGAVVEEDTVEHWAEAILSMRSAATDHRVGLTAASLQLQWQKEAPFLLKAHGL